MKSIVASLALILFANSAMAATCSQNTYDYRLKLVAKDTVNLMQKTLTSLVEVEEDLLRMSQSTSSAVVYFVYAYGSVMGLASELQEVKTQGYWLEKRMEVLKNSCSNLYKEADLENALKSEMTRLIVPAGAKITIDVNLKK